MNLLLTGGCGFIGSHVVDHVLTQPEVARVVNLDCLTYAGRLENVATAAAPLASSTFFACTGLQTS